MTRAIRSLQQKQLLKTFSIVRPELFLWGPIGTAMKTDYYMAKIAKAFSTPNEEQVKELDAKISQFEAARKAQKEGAVIFRDTTETKGSKIQVVALTDKGKQLALTLTSQISEKLTITSLTEKTLRVHLKNRVS